METIEHQLFYQVLHHIDYTTRYVCWHKSTLPQLSLNLPRRIIEQLPHSIPCALPDSTNPYVWSPSVALPSTRNLFPDPCHLPSSLPYSYIDPLNPLHPADHALLPWSLAFRTLYLDASHAKYLYTVVDNEEDPIRSSEPIHGIFVSTDVQISYSRPL